MSGSEAEERIRAIAEKALRETYPQARIVHELVLQQFGCRIDLAAVLPDRLISIEIKSERDVLTRLERQVDKARLVSDAVRVCVADKHYDKAVKISGHTQTTRESNITRGIQETIRESMMGLCNGPARLDMLHASELRNITGGNPRQTRMQAMIYISDHFTGAEIRKHVCAAIRTRYFPRADPPVQPQSKDNTQ